MAAVSIIIPAPLRNFPGSSSAWKWTEAPSPVTTGREGVGVLLANKSGQGTRPGSRLQASARLAS
jgi:hypothetical protein